MNTSYESNNGTMSERVSHKEGGLARPIEEQTAKLPSDVFLWAAGAAMVGSLAFQILGPRPRMGMFGRRVEGRAPLASFVGHWVPTLLIFGLYNKIVKVAGSDRLGS
ncbi:MAG: hypothetical protein JWP97_2877 [Labilithrix sp.]|nr:hypothetical protein [Labilithrix sp.]